MSIINKLLFFGKNKIDRKSGILSEIKNKEGVFMFMKSGKRKAHPLFAIGVGAMALYGAYSMVACMKKSCVEKAEMLTNVFKMGKKQEKHSSEECTTSEENA